MRSYLTSDGYNYGEVGTPVYDGMARIGDIVVFVSNKNSKPVVAPVVQSFMVDGYKSAPFPMGSAGSMSTKEEWKDAKLRVLFSHKDVTDELLALIGYDGFRIIRPKKMTLEEVEKIVGYPIEIVEE